MNRAIHPVKAFLNSYAALEVRTMTSSCDGCEYLIPMTPCATEVEPC
ncbi:hypothetical protein RUM4293_04706 [Ruegeria atlantica]|uniref:Uncharacterized protein n=1 Tax=Ruegeria atlantica TaxID=81569 RepID=A0A0P1E9Y3_9RHOB|nr:hypothetical protein RUM4293_04706 [Ruegeria atlantica]